MHRETFQGDCRRVVAKVGSVRHQHTEIELNYVDAGMLVYQRGADEVTLRAGDVALFWAIFPHHIVETGANTSLHWLTLPLAAFLAWHLPESFPQRLMDGQLLLFRHASLSKRCDILFESWQTEINAPATARQKVAIGEVEAFLGRLSLHMPATHEANCEQIALNKAQKMARYIKRHYTKLLTIKQIAQDVNLNPNYAMTLFRQHFNMSILDYMTQFRVAHAQRLLLFSEIPIDEVARQSGFGSISQFYATFKRLVGVTPRQYRHRR